MKLIITFCFLLLFINTAIAQIKVGTPIGLADASAIFDASNTGGANKGMLPPKVALTSTTVWGLAGTNTVDGMMVFNTATAGTGSTTAVTPGMYYWYISQWISFASPASASVATGTFNCSGITNSISPNTNGFTNGLAYNGSVTVPYTAATNGSYPADSSIVQGIRLYHASGIINSATGNIVYAISGTFTGTTGVYNNFPLTLPGGTACTAGLPALATFVNSSLNCNTSTAAAGTYQIGVATTSANTKTVAVTPATAGAYSINTATTNGVSFSGNGVFTAAQVSAATAVTVTLTATGTPTMFGVNTFTVTAGTQTCTFTVTVANAATFNCSSTSQTQSPQGSFVTNSAYTGTYTVAYTAGNGNSYASTTQTSAGISFTRVAGTYAAGGGNIVYNLSGTYTGGTGTVQFAVAECGTNVSYGYDNVRLALSTSLTSYDAATAGSWVLVTAAEFNNVSSTVSSTSKIGSSETDMSNTNINISQTNGLQTVPGAILPANNYMIGFSYVAYQATNLGSNASIMGSTTSFTTAYTNYPVGVTLPAVNINSGRNYFVFKKQSAVNTSGPTYLAHAFAGRQVYIEVGNGFYYGNLNGTIPDATNATNLSYYGPQTVQIQFLVTPTKQW